MPRKNNKKNPLQIALRAKALPPGVSPKRYFGRLMEHVRFGTPLPRAWDVEIGWRNPRSRGRTRGWQFDEFEDAVSDSREGFNSLLYDMLYRRFLRADPLASSKRKPEAKPKNKAKKAKKPKVKSGSRAKKS